MIRIFVGLLCSIPIAYLAFKKGLLSFTGYIGAVIIGTLLYFFGSIYLSAIMVAFFVSASVITKFKHLDKDFLKDINEKNGGRDYGQVFANGGLGLCYAFLFYITKSEPFLIAYTAAFASANSDTWSSELGVLSKSSPWSIITFKRAERGMSGAVSLLGLFAAGFGSFFISSVFFLGYIVFYGWRAELPYYFILIGISGILGSLIDSYLGALIQGKYKCVVCGKTTEKKQHHGKKTIKIKGFEIVNNDVVNFISSLMASILAALLSLLL